MTCLQAADEEELVHLQSLLAQSQAAEAEAIRRARAATEQLSATSAQHVRRTESDLQQVYFACTKHMHLPALLHPCNLRPSIDYAGAELAESMQNVAIVVILIDLLNRKTVESTSLGSKFSVFD